jgi:type IV secretion system protein VirB1
MLPVDFNALAQECAPQTAPATLAAIVRTESGFNPYAIGVVGGRLARQPSSAAEAVATARELERHGWNYSVGLAQVNRSNFARYGLTADTAFEPCRNLMVGAAILGHCFETASTVALQVQQALRAGLSCYGSGDFVTGYRTGYVQRVVANASVRPVPVVPAIEPGIAPTVTPIPVVPLEATGTAGRLRRQIGEHGQRASVPTDQEDRKHDPPNSSAVVF